jgi:sulfoxide reductase heme-binding subunit YedZ
LRRRLLVHHAPLALATALILALFMGLSPFDTRAYPQTSMGPGVFPQAVPQEQMGGNEGPAEQSSGRQLRFLLSRVTTATGYLATGLLGLTLLIGPANLLFRRRTPVSSYLRRDVGMWTAMFSVVHVIFGMQLHSGGQISSMLGYFFAPDGRLMLDNFGLGNWTGLTALVIVLLLLTLSTDAALRELKAPTWKDLQRLNYTLFGLVILHALFYGALLRLTSPYTLLGVLTVIAVAAGQAVGIWLWRRRFVRRAGRPAPQPS